MSDKSKNLKDILECGVIAVVRAESSDKAVKIAHAISEGGITPIEITMTVPDAVEAIKQVSSQLKDKIITGVGTVTSVKMAEDAVEAGAQFVVTPVLDINVIRYCVKAGIPVISGAYTPTEIFTAWQAGADVVKVFPATSLGPKYFKDIKGPLPQIKLLPTGGVSLENVGEFIKAGAVAIAVGGELVNKKAVAEGKYEVITGTAKKFVDAVKKARSEK